MLKRSLLILALSLMAWLPLVAQAQTLEQVIGTGEAKVEEGQRSQRNIDRMVEAQQGKLIQYRALLKQIEGLEQYNEQLDLQVQGQQLLIDQFEASTAQVARIERQMLPLILRMASSLEDFVELDLPFHGTERQERLAYVQRSINRADVDVAEKFRQVIEAYQVEGDYGRTIDSYQDIIELDGQPREVDVLRWGRIALVAQTRDTRRTAVWDINAGDWKLLDADAYRNSVRHAIRMANKQASIELITLPIRAPEIAE